MALRRLIEGIKDNKLAATMVFVDFKKTFDSIPRRKWLEMLRHMGYQIKSYKNTEAMVRTPGEDTNIFQS